MQVGLLAQHRAGASAWDMWCLVAACAGRRYEVMLACEGPDGEAARRRSRAAKRQNQSQPRDPAADALPLLGVALVELASSPGAAGPPRPLIDSSSISESGEEVIAWA